jgi:hypothetical protein
MLGFDPERDIDQIPLDFMFEDDAESARRRRCVGSYRR